MSDGRAGGGALTGPALRDWLRGRIAFYLDQPEASLDPDAPLTDYGMDSVYAASVLGDVEDHLGVEVETAAAWEHPTINLMAARLEEALAAGAAARPAAEDA